MDEQHEATKEEKGWLTESRRCVSWLLYLSDSNVEGGTFRAFLRQYKGPYCGAHAGNIQVGWLGSDSDSDSDDCISSNRGSMTGPLYDPVFLDSWVRAPAKNNALEIYEEDEEEDSEDQLQCRPLYSLYRVQQHGHGDHISY